MCGVLLVILMGGFGGQFLAMSVSALCGVSPWLRFLIISDRRQLCW